MSLVLDVSSDQPPPLGQVAVQAFTPEEVTALAKELVAYQQHFAPLFYRREQREWAEVYLRGLLTADVPRKNVEAMAGPPSLGQSLQIIAQWLLISPVGFAVEEVFFRGGLDTYLHRGEKGVGWLSAIYVSLLWGIWHLPGQSVTSAHLVSRLVGILLPQLLVGVPLSLFWRASGNLVVNNTAHALLDAVRNGLAGASLL